VPSDGKIHMTLGQGSSILYKIRQEWGNTLNVQGAWQPLNTAPFCIIAQSSTNKGILNHKHVRCHCCSLLILQILSMFTLFHPLILLMRFYFYCMLPEYQFIFTIVLKNYKDSWTKWRPR